MGETSLWIQVASNGSVCVLIVILAILLSRKLPAILASRQRENEKQIEARAKERQETFGILKSQMALSQKQNQAMIDTFQRSIERTSIECNERTATLATTMAAGLTSLSTEIKGLATAHERDRPRTGI